MANDNVTSNLSDVISRVFFMSKRNKIAIRPMKLQKLLFFSYGWYAGKTGNKLFTDGFEAWPYGPVIPFVYHRYSEWGADAINEKGREIDLGDEEANSLVDSAVVKYGPWSDMALSDITHKRGSPWFAVWQKNIDPHIRNPIDFENIRDFYNKKLCEAA